MRMYNCQLPIDCCVLPINGKKLGKSHLLAKPNIGMGNDQALLKKHKRPSISTAACFSEKERECDKNKAKQGVANDGNRSLTCLFGIEFIQHLSSPWSLQAFVLNKLCDENGGDK